MASVQQLMRFIPMAEGSAAKVTLSARQLQQLAARNQQTKAVAEKLLAKLENPTLEVAYKAKSNYSIAGLTLRDGQNIVGTGAVSITNPGSSQAVVKYRINHPAGRANGFIDGGKVARTDDAAIGLARKGGNLKADVQIGDAMAHHIQANEKQMVDLAKDLEANNFLEKYVQSTRNLQRGADTMMTQIRKIFRGEPIKEPWTAQKVTKVAPVSLGIKNSRC